MVRRGDDKTPKQKEAVDYCLSTNELFPYAYESIASYLCT